MKYFLAQDDDCHWYLIEASKREEWEKWRNSYDEPEGWVLPDFAKMINGPSEIEFEYSIQE